MFYEFWVQSLWGSEMIALVANAIILVIIGMLGRFGIHFLFFSLLIYLTVFLTLLLGPIAWFFLWLMSMVYFFVQLWTFLQR